MLDHLCYHRPMKWRLVVLLMLGVMVITSYSAVYAQTPTPDPTPTPAYITEIEIEPGVTFVVERNISYGNIAVVAAILMLIVVNLVSWLTSLVTKLIRN